MNIQSTDNESNLIHNTSDTQWKYKMIAQGEIVQSRKWKYKDYDI